MTKKAAVIAAVSVFLLAGCGGGADGSPARWCTARSRPARTQGIALIRASWGRQS